MPADFLAVPYKETGFLNIADAVDRYLKSNVSKAASKDAAGELTEAQLIRNNAAERSGNPDEIRAKLLRRDHGRSHAPGLRYYAYLSALEAALPVGREKGGVQVAFSWGDAFNPRDRPQSTLISYEKAAILFNVAAAAVQAAQACDVTTDAGLKAAAKRYQEAAGIFAHIGGTLHQRMPPPLPADMAADSTATLQALCLAQVLRLAQAQELTYTKAAANGKSPPLLARIAKQVEAHYSAAQSTPKSDALQRNMGRTIPAHLTAKAHLFGAIVMRHQAEGFIAADECGSQITCLQEAVRRLQAGRREASAGRVNADLSARLAEAETETTAALAKAERENGGVYLQRVPAVADLPPVQPAPLVQPIALPPDLDAVDPRWFQYLRNGGSRDQGGGLFGLIKGILQ